VGLFSSIGKIFKTVTKVASIASSFIPGVGGLASKGLNLLSAKIPGGGNTLKAFSPLFNSRTKARLQAGSAPAIQKASRVMPGGGIIAYTGGTMNAVVRRVKKKRKTKKKSYPRKRRSSIAKRRIRKSGRRLKFGSPAYRRKYLGHR
jgi:hypothetical protein